MAKRKSNYQNFQSAKGGRMAPLYFDMLESQAWQELTANDIKLYLAMLKKYTAKYTKGMLVSSNKDNISMARSEYIQLMNNRTFFKSIDHLIELGFIKVISTGSRYGKQKCNIYGFNDMWQRYGTDSFRIKNEWRREKNRDR